MGQEPAQQQNNQATNTQVQGTPVETPAQPGVTVLNAQPFVPPATYAVPVSASQMQAKKSKLPLILGIIFTLVLLSIGALVAMYLLILSPSAQSKKASQSFMTAVTTGDLEKLYTLDDATDTESKDFLKKASDSMEGSYKQIDSKNNATKWYYLYSLDGAKNKYARTVVEKMNSKWTVTSIVYSANTLSTIPETTSATKNPEPVATTDAQPVVATSPKTAVTTCISQDDYKYMAYDKQPSSITYDTTYNPPMTSNYTTDMFFEPESTTESSVGSVYDDWADFAAHTASKQWKFHLSGTVFVSGANSLANPDAVALSNSRATKVKEALVSRGVPADRIIIDTPINNSAEYQDTSTVSIYRRVEILIDPTCTSQ